MDLQSGTAWICKVSLKPAWAVGLQASSQPRMKEEMQAQVLATYTAPVVTGYVSHSTYPVMVWHMQEGGVSYRRDCSTGFWGVHSPRAAGWRPGPVASVFRLVRGWDICCALCTWTLGPTGSFWFPAGHSACEGSWPVVGLSLCGGPPTRVCVCVCERLH